MEYTLLNQIDFDNNINDRVYIIFLAKDVDVRTQKNGREFINLTMKHKDLEINAKLFEASKEHIDMIKNGYVYNAAVDIKPYAKSEKGWSCVIYNIEPCTTVTMNEFIEWADGMGDAQVTINNALAIINESEYRDIVYPILVDYWNRFYVWTAASGQHHNILGGLLVHTAEVIDQCILMADYWNQRYNIHFINKGLLISAALLHDICKVDELNVDTSSGTTEYSIHSSLSTHIMDILSRVDIQAYKIGFGRQKDINELTEDLDMKTDEEIAQELEQLNLLKHCLASHHGKREYGSPIVPSIPEAIILNQMDELSALMFKFNKNFKKMECKTSSHVWAGGDCVVTYKDSSKI